MTGHDTDDYRAVALFYDGSHAPQIAATGSGELGREITAIAEACGVPLMQNAVLTELLAAFDVGDSIPESLYITIAEVIAFAWMLSGKRPESWEDVV